jgi:O-methyltransferase
MNDFFIATPPFSNKKAPAIINKINKLIRSRGYWYAIKPLLDPFVAMNSIEQRSNFYLLLDAIIAYDIEGDVVELGCFTGQCAMLFQKTLEERSSNKALHLYDSFESKFGVEGNVEKELFNNFKNEGLKQPALHKGYFEATLPSQLPDKISFVHIDCGFGGDKIQHKNIILHCLEHVYPRMSKGAVCTLMDYHDSAIVPEGFGYDSNPGVKLACDEFLASRPEKVTSLFANEFSHGFFRKL